MKILGYTIEDLKNHLESLFIQGMGWNNYGKGEGKWVIDHIKPRCSFTFDSVNDFEFKKCWSLTNLRPLWDYDNNLKSIEDKKLSLRINN